METGDRLDRIAAALVRRGVNFVVIGAWAAELQGFDLGYKTDDIDVTPDFSTANLERLSEALYDLGAMIRTGDEELPFNHDGDSLGRASVWNLTCDEGDFDLTFKPPGIGGYRELLASCNIMSVEVDGERINVPCAHPADIWLSKKAVDRPKDREALPILYAQLGASARDRIEDPRRPRGAG
ncbi:MAG: hypothetical protein F4Z06_02675 [Acidimicrobiia bacterium]|nr:hypothetical protein [Acidimicrobiia bacterium]MYE71916.1 hypothetical protein [Acidimicrobiia bacterium]MYJ60825.1 hypothetical protein [Acidimicrobiia bacterium]